MCLEQRQTCLGPSETLVASEPALSGSLLVRCPLFPDPSRPPGPDVCPSLFLPSWHVTVCFDVSLCGPSWPAVPAPRADKERARGERAGFCETAAQPAS